MPVKGSDEKLCKLRYTILTELQVYRAERDAEFLQSFFECPRI